MNDKKQEFIWRLQDAKRAHISWVGHALALIDGLPIAKEQIPINPRECAFGGWYYGEGRVLVSIEEFEKIEKTHDQLHATYAAIVELLFAEKNRSLFSRLLGSVARGSQQDQEEARNQYLELSRLSKAMIRFLERLESRLESMPDAEFEGLFKGR